MTAGEANYELHSTSVVHINRKRTHLKSVIQCREHMNVYQHQEVNTRFGRPIFGRFGRNAIRNDVT